MHGEGEREGERERESVRACTRERESERKRFGSSFYMFFLPPALRQINVTAPFYLEDSRRIQDSKRREWRSAWGGREKERERERESARASEGARTCICSRMHAGERVPEKALWLLILYVFSSTWACPMQIGLSQECCLFCLFCLKSSLWSSDLPLTFLVF